MLPNWIEENTKYTPVKLLFFAHYQNQCNSTGNFVGAQSMHDNSVAHDDTIDLQLL